MNVWVDGLYGVQEAGTGGRGWHKQSYSLYMYFSVRSLVPGRLSGLLLVLLPHLIQLGGLATLPQVVAVNCKINKINSAVTIHEHPLPLLARTILFFFFVPLFFSFVSSFVQRWTVTGLVTKYPADLNRPQ